MLAITAPPAVYAGVREIQRGGVWYEELSPARYAVTERYATARWEGRIGTLHGTIVFEVRNRPATGIYLTGATIDQREQNDSDGSVRLLSYERVTSADHVGALPSSSSSSLFQRTDETSFRDGQTILPASLKPHRVTLPLAATSHHAESDRGGPLGGSYAESDVRRTTAADGSFEETGSVQMGPAVHRVRQQADGSATAYDSVTGFSMRDVAVAAPTGTGPGARVAVTVKSQGRTIGPTPIDTNEYVVPVWYATTWPAPLATATLVVEPPRAPDARCALGTAALVPVVIERTHVDVTGQIVEQREERDVDRARRVLCHLTTTITRRYDVTNGAATGAIIDTTVVHLKAV